MEAALKPQVLAALDQIAALYKKLGKLQDASVEAALRPTSFPLARNGVSKKLRNETMDLVNRSSLTTIVSRPWLTRMYGINRRLVSLKANCCVWPKPMAWIGLTFLSSISAMSSIQIGLAASVGCRALAGTILSPRNATRSKFA